MRNDEIPAPGLDPRHRLARAVHGGARQPRRERRAAEHPPRPRRLDPVAGVDRQRLRALLRRPAADRRGARRSLRAQAHVHGRDRAVHGLLGGGRAGAVDRAADRRPGRPGNRRGDRHAADADPAGRRLPARAARHGDRRLVGDQRRSPSRSGRWSAARSFRPPRGTGSSGSTSRSGWCWSRSPRRAWPRATARHAQLDLRGLALGSAGLFGIVFGLVRSQSLGWSNAAGAGRSLAGRGAAGGAFIVYERRDRRSRCCR